MLISYMPFYFMKNINRNIYRCRALYVLAYILLFSIMSIVVLIVNPILNYIITALTVALIGHLLYNDKILYKLYYILFTVGLFLFDGLLIMIHNLVPSIFKISINNIYIFITVGIIFIRTIEFIYTKIIIKFINKRDNDKLDIKEIIKFSIVPLFSSIYMITLTYYFDIFGRRIDMIIFLVNAVSLVLLNMYILYIFDNISRKNKLQNEVSLYEQQKELNYRYYDNLESKYQESRKLAHDIRNHLITLEELYKDNEKEVAKKYTNDIHSMLNELNQKYYTSNRVLNIILNDKIHSIRNEDIDIEIRIKDVELDFIRDIDLTTIFTNLLDNSIESVVSIKENRYINLDIGKFNELLVINIANSTNKKPIYKGNVLKSTKAEHRGLGIQNIKKTIEKYDGDISINHTDNEFKVNIIIPI